MHRPICFIASLCMVLLGLSVSTLGATASAIEPENVSGLAKILALNGHTGYVRDVAFSPDGLLLASIGDDRCVRLWNVTTGEEIHTFRIPGSAAYLNSLSFSPDGRFLASPHGVWDLQTCAAVRLFEGEVTSTAFSPDGSLLAIGAIMLPVQLLDTTTWALVRTFESLREISPTADDSFGFEFSPDGVLLVDGTLNAGQARVWSVDTGTLVTVLAASGSGTDVHDVAFSSDGRLLAAGGQGEDIVLFRMENGDIESRLPTGEGTMSLDFSPDDRLLAVSCEGALSLWDVEIAARIRFLPHDGAVLPVAFSPDGKWLACGLYGGEIVIWGIRE